MGSDILEIGEDGARLKVWLGVDTGSALLLAGGLFVALTCALIIYAKVK